MAKKKHHYLSGLSADELLSLKTSLGAILLHKPSKKRKKAGKKKAHKKGKKGKKSAKLHRIRKGGSALAKYKAAKKRRGAKAKSLAAALQTHGKNQRQRDLYAQYYHEKALLKKKYFGK